MKTLRNSKSFFLNESDKKQQKQSQLCDCYIQMKTATIAITHWLQSTDSVVFIPQLVRLSLLASSTAANVTQFPFTLFVIVCVLYYFFHSIFMEQQQKDCLIYFLFAKIKKKIFSFLLPVRGGVLFMNFIRINYSLQDIYWSSVLG